MKTTHQLFADFDDRLRLDVAERLEAIELHNRITTILRASGLITGAFLQGSFRRKTMRSPLHDVDKILLLHRDLGHSNPHSIMARIEAALHPHFEGIMFEYTKHSLKLHLPGCRFTFDAVPAFESDEETDDDVLIANTESGRWQRSNTRALIRVVAERNDRTNGHFVLYVREMKQFVHNQLGDKFPGLHVESIAFHAVDKRIDHHQACLDILNKGAELLGGSYFDPTGVDRISDRLDGGVALHARAIFAEGAAKAREAVQLAERGQHGAANALWYDLFGPPFPEPKSSSAGDAIAATFAGGVVDRIGRVQHASRSTQETRPTRAWRP